MSGILRNYRAPLILLASVIIGVITGAALGPKASVLKPFGSVFLNIMFCVIVPLVFVSVANAVAGIVNVNKLGKLFGTVFGVIFTAGLATAVITLIITYPLKLAQGFDGDLSSGDTALSSDGAVDFSSLLTVPSLVDLLSLSHMTALIIFALLFGLAVSASGKDGQPVGRLLASLTSVFNKFVGIVMYYAPFGIGCYFASLVGDMGTQAVTSIIRPLSIYVIIALLYFLVFYSSLTFLGGGKEGVRRYWKHIWTPWIVAAGTCSSSASIPSNLTATEKMGVPREISGLVVPLAGVLHKEGVVIMAIIKIIFAFELLGIDPGAGDIVKAIIVAMICGIVAGAIPSGGFIVETFISTAFGFPPEVLAIIIVLGTLSDPINTATSVAGQPAISVLITRLVRGRNWISAQETAISKDTDTVLAPTVEPAFEAVYEGSAYEGSAQPALSRI